MIFHPSCWSLLPPDIFAFAYSALEPSTPISWPSATVILKTLILLLQDGWVYGRALAHCERFILFKEHRLFFLIGFVLPGWPFPPLFRWRSLYMLCLTCHLSQLGDGSDIASLPFPHPSIMPFCSECCGIALYTLVWLRIWSLASKLLFSLFKRKF